MAKPHNALPHYTDLTRGIRRAFGLDQGEGIERLGETLQLDTDIFNRPEYSYMIGRKPGVGTRIVASVAAEYGGMAIGLAVSARSIAIVERFSANRSDRTAAVFYMTRGLALTLFANFGNDAAPCVRDERANVAAWQDILPAAGVQYGTAAAIPVGDRVAVGLAGPSTCQFGDLVLPYVITPGRGLCVYCGTANVEVVFNVKWYELPITPGLLDV